MKVDYQKIPKKLRPAVSAKIRSLMREGKSQRQAIATALTMARHGRLGKRGGYKRNPEMGADEARIVGSLGKLANSLGGKTVAVDEYNSRLEFQFPTPAKAQSFSRESKSYDLVKKVLINGREVAVKMGGKRYMGNVRRNPIADKDLAPVIAFLLYLRNFPTWSENVPDRVLTILIDEGLYSIDDGVTEKGEKFIQDSCVETDDERAPDDY